MSNKKTSVSKINNSLSISDNNIDEQIKLFTAIAKASNSGINTPEEGILLYNKANALGIPWAMAIGNMSAINGKIGLNIHLIKGILSKPENNIRWEYEHNYSPVYQYITQLGDIITDDDFDPTVHIKVPLKDIKTPNPDGLINITYNIAKSKKVIVNRRTRIKFTRIYPNGDVIVKYSEFSYLDSVQAGLGLTKSGEISIDSPWYKYPKLMIDHRAFTFGAREIASDLLLGCLEMKELLDINNINYKTDDDNNIIVDGESVDVTNE